MHVVPVVPRNVQFMKDNPFVMVVVPDDDFDVKVLTDLLNGEKDAEALTVYVEGNTTRTAIRSYINVIRGK